jgi:hypothetical protein
MWQTLVNLVLFRRYRADRLIRKFNACFASEATEDFLAVLLDLMGLVACLDPEFRRNLKDFDGRYLFKSQDQAITVTAQFRNQLLVVTEKPINDAHVTVCFKNASALMNLLRTPKPDILGSLLRQEVRVEGNLNYLYKFAYMAQHLRLAVCPVA